MGSLLVYPIDSRPSVDRGRFAVINVQNSNKQDPKTFRPWCMGGQAYGTIGGEHGASIFLLDAHSSYCGVCCLGRVRRYVHIPLGR